MCVYSATLRVAIAGLLQLSCCSPVAANFDLLRPPLVILLPQRSAGVGSRGSTNRPFFPRHFWVVCNYLSMHQATTAVCVCGRWRSRRAIKSFSGRFMTVVAGWDWMVLPQLVPLAHTHAQNTQEKVRFHRMSRYRRRRS